jgi:hypothetical protein
MTHYAAFVRSRRISGDTRYRPKWQNDSVVAGNHN